jgi:hypothetical protein
MTDPIEKQKKINDLELTVRTIQEMLPELPTSQLHKWYAIGRTFLAHVEQEMKATCLHTCRICFFEEWGYRDDLPVSWYKKGDAEICFQHEYDQAEKLLKDAGYEVDAFFPPEPAQITPEGLKVHMEKNLPPPATEAEQTLEELMDLI